MSAMLVYDVRLSDGSTVQFGTRRGVGTVAAAIRLAMPTAIAWTPRGRKHDTAERVL